MRRSAANMFGAGRPERGAAALETAFILPVLLVMLFGLLEIGRMYFVKSTLTKAAETGARFAVTGRGVDDGTRLPKIVAEARRLADTFGPERVDVAVRSYPVPFAGGDPRENDAGAPCEMVEVEVSCGYDPVTPFLSEALPSDLSFTAKKRMVNEPWLPCD
jgi:hypothetical protein